ncbi:MAG TPA: pyridoxal-dependent decarboxylase [Gemmatimonadaceae bacterium]|nr:pyridoxal-dependent decarboxylase [Gemmatimonadaceae bacterium]
MERDLGKRSDSGDMSPEDFRRYGHMMVDRIARYLEEAERAPVLSRARPGMIRASLPDAAPRAGEDMEAILADFDTKILPGITHWNHPGFMAYFAITGSGPGILGEMLAAGLNVNAMVWRGSPAATELEEVTLDWLRQLMGLPDPLFGEITDTASSSTLYALAAAREFANLGIHERGTGDLKLRVYCSEEAHSSVDKAVITLGLGSQALRKIPVDDRFRMRPDLLQQAIDSDRAAGFRPIAVVATVGTTGTTAVDPVVEIAGICERAGTWLHVDASYAGVAAIVPEKRYVLAGAERAHSLVVNPHKWLFVPIDCSVLYTSEPESLKAAFALPLEILRTPEPGVTNLMDYGLSLGRRFRALKLWFVLRYFGADGLASRLREHMRLAQVVARWAETSDMYELCAPVEFSTVVFRRTLRGASLEEANAMNSAILSRVNDSGEAFLSGTKIRGAQVIRLSIGNLRTTEEHVRRTLDLLDATAREL